MMKNEVKTFTRWVKIYNDTVPWEDTAVYVTEIGCGKAGFTPEQIAPFFSELREIQCVYLPESFWDVLLKDVAL